MDHVITTLPAEDTSWKAALIISSLFIIVSLIGVYGVMKRIDKGSKPRLYTLVKYANRVLITASVVSLSIVTLTIGSAIGTHISYVNESSPRVSVIANKLGLHTLPGSNTNVFDSEKVWVDQHNNRYSNCYVVTKKLDKRHISSQLFCSQNNKPVIVKH